MLAQIVLVEQLLLHNRDLNQLAYASLLLSNGQDLYGVWPSGTDLTFDAEHHH